MPYSMRKVAHLTSAHPRDDVRIFHKECKSLVRGGYEVHLIVADHLGDECRDGVCILDVGGASGRLGRIFGATRRILAKAFQLDADIYHLHDPELLWVGLMLARRGKRVVFDSHEDVPLQLLNKPYLRPSLLRLLSLGYVLFERYACSRFSGIIGATPFIRDKFRKINACSIDVCNYPLLEEFLGGEDGSKKALEICYVGGLSAVRGIREMVLAMSLVKNEVSLNLVGAFSEPGLHEEVRAHPGWGRIIEYGVLGRRGVAEIYLRSKIGLVTLQPIPNYLDALPIKMFEYMSAGIPVVASDFPLWKEIVMGSKCGLCVNPLDPSAIAEAIDYLIDHPDEASKMGERGREAVLSCYNWRNEEAKFLNFYSHLALVR